MGLHDKSIVLPKIKRSVKNRNIHNLFVFNRAGLCLYSRNFTSSFNMEEHLITAFFSALMSFTSEVIGNRIKIIEMEGEEGKEVKFIIIEKGQLFYGLLCKSIENLILLEDIILKINSEILNFIKESKIKINTEYIYSDELDQVIDEIIEKNSSNVFDIEKEQKIIEYLEQMSYNDEIVGAVLITDKGKVLYSSLDSLNLKNFLKEVDFRIKIWNNSILKLFYTSKNKELIFSEYIEDLYFIIFIYDVTTKFGMAEYILTKTVKFIKKVLEE